MAVVGDRREGCDGCGQTVPLEDLTAVGMPGGEPLACCPRCEPHAREAADRLASLDTTRADCDGCTTAFPAERLSDVVLPDGAVVTVCPDCRTEAPGSDTGSSGESTELATQRALCTQCREWSNEERYHVTTIDGRAESLCPPCKDRAEAEGVVRSVELRETEAREILGVEDGVSDDEIRQAFLRQVKRAHPDRKQGSRSAFKLVTEAYDRLA